MADPRFYDNRGPFKLADLAARVQAQLPAGANGGAEVRDIATLEGAGAEHLAFCAGKTAAKALAATHAGFCLIGPESAALEVPQSVVALTCQSVSHAFAAAVALFYPEHSLDNWNQQTAVDPSARIDKSVRLGPGVAIGPNVEIGAGTRIGANTVIGRGVAIGRNCEIGGNVTLSHAYLGDRVLILPGAQIGQPGFGFASGARGHVKMPQVGRVMVQDDVEIGANTTVDRGAIGDTVIGEGTKIDNLVQIGHNTRIGRHCVIVSQVGISGSCELGDFVVLGGQVGVADHAQIGDGARLAARSAAAPGPLPGGQDYGGVPARPLKEWKRELAAVAILARRKKRNGNG